MPVAQAGEPAMKSFLSALVFYAVIIAATGFIYTRINYTTTDAYSTESARVGHESEANYDGRLGWTPPDS